MLELLLIFGTALTSGTLGFYVHKVRSKKITLLLATKTETIRKEVFNNNYLLFEDMLQEAGFIIGKWKGFGDDDPDKNGTVFHMTYSNVFIKWNCAIKQKFAEKLDGNCPNCQYPIYRLISPTRDPEDNKKSLGLLGSCCSNFSCGKLFKDSTTSSYFKNYTDTLSLLDSFINKE